MHVRSDWRRTTRTWSTRLLFISTGLASAQLGLQALVDLDKWTYNPLLAAGLLAVLNLAAFVARFIAQPSLGSE